MKIQSMMLQNHLAVKVGGSQSLYPSCSTVEFTMTGFKRAPFASALLAVGKAVGCGRESS